MDREVDIHGADHVNYEEFVLMTAMCGHCTEWVQMYQIVYLPLPCNLSVKGFPPAVQK